MSEKVDNCHEDIKKFIDEVSPHFLSTVKEFLLFLRSVLDAGIEITESEIKKQEKQTIKKVEIK